MCSSFVHVHRNLFLALFDETQAKRMAEHELSHKFLILQVQLSSHEVSSSSLEKSPLDSCHDCCSFIPSSLAQIYKFDENIREISRKNPGEKLVFCAGHDLIIQMKTAFLLGAHLILTHNVDAEGVADAFQCLNEEVEGVMSSGGKYLSLWNCWKSLASAQAMNWLDFWEVFDAGDVHDSCIKLDEYIHYSR